MIPLGRTGTEVFRLNLRAIWRGFDCLTLADNVKPKAAIHTSYIDAWDVIYRKV